MYLLFCKAQLINRSNTRSYHAKK